MKTTKILATAALAIAASSAQASSLVSNGSFEDPGTTSWANYSSIPNWTGGTNGIEIQRNGTVGGVSAFHGSQYVELDTTANSSMWQYLATTADSIYTLNFAYMGRPDNPQSAESNAIEVWWNTFYVGNIASKGAVWAQTTYNLTATGSSTRLEFRAAGTPNSYGGFIDGVSVTAVPEPESYALLLAGLGLLGTLARRTNKSKAD